ncbi:MAG: hypothetical protein AB1427_20570 [Thermodesulfobacteriota bacterium]
MDHTTKPIVKYKLVHYRRDKIPVFEIRLENVRRPLKEQVEGFRQAVLRATALSRRHHCKCEKG